MYELGEGAFGTVEPSEPGVEVSIATLRAVTTWHHHTDNISGDTYMYHSHYLPNQPWGGRDENQSTPQAC